MSQRQASPATSTSLDQPWWKLLTGYHWFVFAVAAAAWSFDCLDQRLFSLARKPALLALTVPGTDVNGLAKVVTALFLIGWGIGGLFFGALGDRFGRARMLTITVLIYSLATGLSFFSQYWWDFALFRFITGVGVGGVFGLAAALIAESVPSGARVQCLGMLQILSTAGNVGAGLFADGISALASAGKIPANYDWRCMFLVGALPAFMVIFIQKYLKEPESWLHLKKIGHLPTGGLLAPYRDLVKEVRWRHHLIVGSLIASTGVVGLWAIGEYAVDLQMNVFTAYYKGQGAAVDQIKGLVDHAKFWAYECNMAGACIGMWIFTVIAKSFGRRLAFFLGFVAALVVTVFVYWKMSTPAEAYWMMALMGAAQLGLFAGFAIYLPELFPSRLRSTGTSFCYNLGRFAAAGGSFFSALLTTQVYGGSGPILAARYSAITMCAIFLVGLITLPFAPETKGQPLVEE